MSDIKQLVARLRSPDTSEDEILEAAATLEEAEELAEKWERAALAAVPPEYASRNLHRKFLKEDNEAAGLSSCAAELRRVLEGECR